VPPTPPLQRASAERMQDAVALADQSVDAGDHPDAAVAKAAQAVGLPAGHVPLVVRAFNTARAVQQLSAPDVWGKAASYPTATEAGVRKHLAAGAGLSVDPPAAVPTVTGNSADYLLPPGFKLPAEPKPISTAPGVPPPGVGLGAAPSGPPTAGPPPAGRIDAAFKAAAAHDEAARAVLRLPAAEYAGVKYAALRKYPALGDFFAAADAERDAPAAAPDPAVGYAHPAVVKAAAYAAALAAVPPAPVVPGTYHGTGYRKIASEPGVDLLQKLPVCPLLGQPIYPPPAAAHAPPGPDVEPLPADGVKLAADPPGAPKPSGGGGKGPLGSFFGGMGSSVGQGSRWFTGAPFAGMAVDTIRDRGNKKTEGLVDSTREKLEANLGRLDTQGHVQTLLEDPRFGKADPKTVIQTYQQLSQLAPRAMANPAVAGDLIHRRLMTGPLSYFDLESLSRIEANLAKSQRPQYSDDDDD